MNVFFELIKEFFTEISLRNAVIIIILYLILHSNTKLGFLLRIFSIWIVYYTYNLYAVKGEYCKGIKEGITIGVVLFWPLILKYIIRFIKLMNSKITGGG